jgi:sensor histidine kinase regulating citrate/malate metabolism
VISVMAAYFEGQAKKEGIRFACKVQVPGTIEIPAEVLTAILGNMWQNALEACERMTQQERYIRTRILYQDGRLIVRCENSFAGTLRYGKRGSRLLSTKGAHRGQGLSNIRRLVKQQGGNCSIEQAKDSVLLTVVLTEEREYQSGGEWNVSNCDM